MTTFIANTDNINENNSFVIENLPTGLSGANSIVIEVVDDTNGDGINDIFIRLPSQATSNDFIDFKAVVFGGNILPSSLSLENVNGSNGFITDQFSFSPSNLKDINGDNISDVLFLVSDVNTNEPDDTIGIFFGDSIFPENIDITAIDDAEISTISNSENSFFTIFFNENIDINNDSINDLIVAFNNGNFEAFEENYAVIFGQEPFPSEIDIANLDEDDGFIILGAGLLADQVIDVNGDGFGDLLFVDDINSSAQILFGNLDFSTEVDFNNLDNSQGFTITDQGRNPDNSSSGYLVGDINGDDVGEIVLEVFNFDFPTFELESSQIFVVYGNSENQDATFDLGSINGSNGFVIENASIVANNNDLSLDFDLNGDNLQDLIVRNITDGSIAVVFGSNNNSSNFNLNNLDGNNGFVFSQNDLVFVGVGDVNGDGFDDIAFDSQDFLGNGTILLGQESFPASVDIFSPDLNTIEILGERNSFGIADIDDINGDSFDDVVLNALFADGSPGASSTILFGDSESLAIATLEDTEDTTIDLFRFRNNSFSAGTYVFVGQEERDAILADANLSNTFSLDGVQEDGSINPAFTASIVPGENLVPFFRIQSLVTPGTFLFVGTEELDAIFAEGSAQANNFERQGFDEAGNDIPEFFLFGVGANQGIEFNRLQNNINGTFLFAGFQETQDILNNPNFADTFTNQGVAFESII